MLYVIRDHREGQLQTHEEKMSLASRLRASHRRSFDSYERSKDKSATKKYILLRSLRNNRSIELSASAKDTHIDFVCLGLRGDTVNFLPLTLTIFSEITV